MVGVQLSEGLDLVRVYLPFLIDVLLSILSGSLSQSTPKHLPVVVRHQIFRGTVLPEQLLALRVARDGSHDVDKLPRLIILGELIGLLHAGEHRQEGLFFVEIFNGCRILAEADDLILHVHVYLLIRAVPSLENLIHIANELINVEDAAPQLLSARPAL